MGKIGRGIISAASACSWPLCRPSGGFNGFDGNDGYGPHSRADFIPVEQNASWVVMGIPLIFRTRDGNIPLFSFRPRPWPRTRGRPRTTNRLRFE